MVSDTPAISTNARAGQWEQPISEAANELRTLGESNLKMHKLCRMRIVDWVAGAFDGCRNRTPGGNPRRNPSSHGLARNGLDAIGAVSRAQSSG